LSDNPRNKRLRILSTAAAAADDDDDDDVDDEDNLEGIPLIGFGTYAVKSPQVIYNALSVGYRHLDLAANYNNLQNVKKQQQLAVAPLTKGGLGIEVNEMICLWEALFPDDQNYFQLHQIKDLVSSIPMHGSMHAWSELFGEQALATLIAYSPLEFNATFIVLQDTVMQSIAEKIGITKAQLSLAWEAIIKGRNGIRDVVFYRHFDLRAQVIYKRITKEEHLESAWEAREKNAPRKTVEDIKVKGVKDVWPFDRLPYSDLARNSSPRHSQGRYL